MQRRLVMTAIVVVSTLVLGGCGVSQSASVPSTALGSSPTRTVQRAVPTPSPTSSSTPSGVGFAPVVARVMTALAHHTRVPVQAPGNPAGCSGGANGGNACWPAAWYQVTSTSFWAHVGICPARQSNGPPVAMLGKASCDESMAALVAGYDFTGRQYPTANQAKASVSPAAPRGSFSTVSLGEGLQGNATLAGLVTWTEGNWHLAVNLSACPAASHPRQQALATAKSVVAYLHTHLLPETFGELQAGGSCGDISSGYTVLSWAWGRDVYSVSTSGYAPLTSVRLAIAMHPAS